MKKIEKPFLVLSTKHLEILFGEDKDDILKQKGGTDRELLVEEIPLPEGWELVRKTDSGRRFVSIEPAMSSGEPTAGRTGYRAEIVAARWWNGESLEFLQEDLPGLDRGHVLVCCWFMAERGSRRWKKRWGEWAKSVSGNLWHSDWEGASMPPTAKENQ